MLLAWMLLGIIILLCKRRVIIYNKESKEVIAIIKPMLNANQILHKDLNFMITTEDIKYRCNDKTGKIYVKEDEDE